MENIVIPLQGCATIDTVAEIHRQLLDALVMQRSITIDCTHVTDCDASFLQLLIALCKSLRAAGSVLEIAPANIPAVVVNAAKTIGTGCRDRCILQTDDTCFLSGIQGTAITITGLKP